MATSDNRARANSARATRWFAREVRAALALGSAAEVIGAPGNERRLLELVVATAMRVIGARAAALLLLDFEGQHLTFEIALGGQSQALAGEIVPLGHGIAGLVAASGQPIAINNASADSRQASDIAARVGYHPQSILCVPLLDDDRTIGVLELLDKTDATTFSQEDMATLGLFAQQAGTAITQARGRRHLDRLVLGLLREAATGDARAMDRLDQRVARLSGALTEDDVIRRSVELAALVSDIARTGEAEARACATMLRGFADFLQGRR
jgi:GAF domain-containing protein